MKRLDTLQELELADGVEIRLRIVGPLLRGMAFLLDVLFVILLMAGLSLISALFASFFGFNVGEGVAQLFFFLCVVVLFFLPRSGEAWGDVGEAGAGDPGGADWRDEDYNQFRH